MFFNEAVAKMLIEATARYLCQSCDENISHKEIELAFDFVMFDKMRKEAEDSLLKIIGKKAII